MPSNYLQKQILAQVASELADLREEVRDAAGLPPVPTSNPAAGFRDEMERIIASIRELEKEEEQRLATLSRVRAQALALAGQIAQHFDPEPAAKPARGTANVRRR